MYYANQDKNDNLFVQKRAVRAEVQRVFATEMIQHLVTAV